MTNTSSIKPNDDELILSFQRAALVFGEAFEKGDSDRSNGAYSVSSIQTELPTKGSSGVHLLVKLLDAEEPWVRYAAASYLLDLQPPRAPSCLG